MYKQILALNNLQWLICHNTKPILVSIKTCPSLTVKKYVSEQKD